MCTGKNIAGMLHVIKGNIADKKWLERNEIDTIVNAAKPTLMGSDRAEGVDHAVHKAIDKLQKNGKNFNQMICKELRTEQGDNIIRCKRGKAVLTSGGKLCKHVIHVVGAQYDGDKRKKKGCSSSRVEMLESCYFEIVKILKEHPKIKNIAIPVISAGEYGFPFETAMEIAIASVGNALVEWKNSDAEMFEMSGIDNIYFCIYDKDSRKQNENYQCAREIALRYAELFSRSKKVVFQTSVRAHMRYFAEISRYDESRGYFSIAKVIRELLMIIRIFFMPWMFLKDLIGKADWEKRRRLVERIALIKAFIPVLCFGIWSNSGLAEYQGIMKYLFIGLMLYNMCDTITYLLALIIMADIQRPSANIIRSLIMLFVNYIEVSLEIAFLYLMYYGNVSFSKAVEFGMLGTEIYAEGFPKSLIDYCFYYGSIGIRFFFVTLVFGYFTNHMKQRKFRS